jgi:hypothetical protein
MNVAATWLAFLLCIRKVPGSNIGPETGYPDRFFVDFLRPSRQMPEKYLQQHHDTVVK